MNVDRAGRIFIVIIGCSSADAFAQHALLTRMDLLAGAEAYRGAVATLRVSYSYDIENAEPVHAHARQHQTLTTKGEKLRWDVTCGRRVDIDPSLFRREVAFNGEQTVSQQITLGQAHIQRGRTLDADTQGKGFFDIAMLNPPREGECGVDDQSLLSVLRSPLASVRPEVERVGDSMCHVVDVIDPPGVGPVLTVWIDADRGYLPMRQVFFDRRDRQRVMMECRIEQATELPGGVWLPVRGWRKVDPRPEVAGLATGPKWNLRVDESPAGYAIAINQPIDDSLFDLANHITPGFTVANIDERTFWIAAGRDFKAVGQSIATAYANTKNGVPVQETAVDLARPRAGGRSWSLAATLIGGVLALCTAPFVVRRSKP